MKGLPRQCYDASLRNQVKMTLTDLPPELIHLIADLLGKEAAVQKLIELGTDVNAVESVDTLFYILLSLRNPTTRLRLQPASLNCYWRMEQ